jgi:hypothetical protein
LVLQRKPQTSFKATNSWHESPFDNKIAFASPLENGFSIQRNELTPLLNISARVPPEILGRIFSWAFIRRKCPEIWLGLHFDGLEMGSYNFLLVCHHWFEVAYSTPQLWTFWGETFRKCAKQHRRAGAIPVDLVLNGLRCDPDDHLDTPLQDALRDRARDDTIRRVHILNRFENPFLSSILSLLTPSGEYNQTRSIESLDLRSWATHTEDTSIFFARIRLPKLRRLVLHGGFNIPPWDNIASQTTLLTHLCLNITGATTGPLPLLSYRPSSPQIPAFKLLH